MPSDIVLGNITCFFLRNNGSVTDLDSAAGAGVPVSTRRVASWG